MADEQKISKWWFWAFPALANLLLLVVYIVVLVPAVLQEFTYVRAPKPLLAAEDAAMRVVDVFGCLIYEPIRWALGLTHRQFYSRSTILFIWELMAFAGGLLCHKVATRLWRVPKGQSEQPGDRGRS